MKLSIFEMQMISFIIQYFYKRYLICAVYNTVVLSRIDYIDKIVLKTINLKHSVERNRYKFIFTFIGEFEYIQISNYSIKIFACTVRVLLFRYLLYNYRFLVTV